jgi:hypothetical protein
MRQIGRTDGPDRTFHSANEWHARLAEMSRPIAGAWRSPPIQA